MSSLRWRRGGMATEKHVEAIEEILPEGPAAHRLHGILIGGGHHPHVHRELALTAEAPQGPLLQDAEILRLECRAHLGDLVEEDGSACRPARSSPPAGPPRR